MVANHPESLFQNPELWLDAIEAELYEGMANINIMT
jgi:hypothetical protein